MLPIYYFAGALIVWNLVLTFFLVRMFLHYKNLTGGVAKKDLISALNHFIALSRQNSDDLKSLSEKLGQEIVENKKHIQKIGFKRYNPFTDTGGDQSFTITVLDDNNNGIMVSSLHSRENTRLYAKRVEAGQVPDQVLSAEEKEVIKQALK